MALAHPQISPKWLILSASIVGTTLIATFLLLTIFDPLALSSYIKPSSLTGSKTPQNPPENNLAKSIQNIIQKKEVSAGLPIRLKIPKLNIDTPLEYTGITPSGEMSVPNGPTNAAWFKLGPHPGNKGTAIISGHYGWKNNIPAIFDNLHKLQKGDKVSVKDEKGVITTFIVRKIQIYGEKDDTLNIFNSGDEGAHLNLITCGGTWSAAKKSYSNRIVVFTDKESP